VSASVQILHGLHARWTVFWETLPADAWQRIGIHPTQGPLTLEQLLGVYTGHGDAHIDQIRRGVAARYGEASASRPPTHAELLHRFDREWARLHGLVERLTPTEFVARGEDRDDGGGKGCGGGWSPKDHVAHITSWERYLARTEIGGQPVVESLGFALETAGARLTIEEINGRIYAANMGKTSAQVLAEFDTVHAEARAAVTGIDYAAWTGPVH
jgi:hypothetical protein